MKIDSPNILFISSWYPTDKKTAGTFVEMLALVLNKKRGNVAVLLYDYISFGTWIKNGFRFIKFPKYRKNPNIKFIEVKTILLPSFLDRYNKRLIQVNALRKVRSFAPDLIHQHGIVNGTYITEFLSNKFNVPYVYTEHAPFEVGEKINLHHPFVNLFEIKEFIKKAKLRMAVSHFYANVYSQLFDCPFDVVPNVVSDDFIQSDRKDDSKVFYFLSVGYLEKIKNHALLIDAFAILLKKNPAVKLKIVGSGTLFNSLATQVKKYNIQNEVEFLGTLNRENLKNQYKISHALVVSSEKETFGVVAVEAFFAGLPVISTRCGGTEELINSTNGLITDTNSALGLAEKMNEIVMNYSLYNSREIKLTAIANYGEDAITNKLFKIYTQSMAALPI